MKMNTLDDIYRTLDEEKFEITIDEAVATKAKECIEKMLLLKIK